MNMKRARDIYKHAHMERFLVSEREVVSKNALGIEVTRSVQRHERVPQEKAPGFKTWARKNTNIQMSDAEGKLARILSRRGNP